MLHKCASSIAIPHEKLTVAALQGGRTPWVRMVPFHYKGDFSLYIVVDKNVFVLFGDCNDCTSLVSNPKMLQADFFVDGLLDITRDKMVLCVLLAVLEWRFQAIDPQLVVDGLIYWWQTNVLGGAFEEPVRSQLVDDVDWTISRWVHDLAEGNFNKLHVLGLTNVADNLLRIPSLCNVIDCGNLSAHSSFGLNICLSHFEMLCDGISYDELVMLFAETMRWMTQSPTTIFTFQ